MAVVAGRVEALRPAGGDIVLVHLGGGLVGRRGVGVAADPVVDVAGHVHDVARPGISFSSRSAAGSARSGVVEASTAWM